MALARVLVMEPKALLLDEPLGDLDRLLRLRMRVELRALQRQLGLMFIHVTHDQEEALSVGDRIVVMHEGRIEQVADPFTISNLPENVQVAAFMGDNNIFEGTVTAQEGERVSIDGGDAELRALGARDRKLSSDSRPPSRCAPPPCRSDDAGGERERAEPAPGRDRGRSSTSATSSSCIWPSADGAWSRRSRATASRSSRGRKEAACGCPGRRRMSDSSES